MAFGFMHGGVNNQPNADVGPSRVIRALAPRHMAPRHGADDQKISVRHMMTAAAAMIAVATQPMSLKPSWM
jgi:hypothetical protein